MTEGAPAKTTKVKLTSGRRLRTLTGTLDELREAETGDDWLRVRVNEARRPDLADQVREILGPRCVDVLVDSPTEQAEQRQRLRSGRSPQELFEAYLADLNISDARLTTVFDELLAEYHGGGGD